MASVSDEKIHEVAKTLWRGVYEASFRGKERGRFSLTREQLKRALDTSRLHTTTIERLQDEALSFGLIIIDLDDLFPCIEVKIVRKYRRPPAEVFYRFFPKPDEEEMPDGDDDE